MGFLERVNPLIYNWGYRLVNIQKAIENGPVEIVDFPMKNDDFPWQNVSSPEGI